MNDKEPGIRRLPELGDGSLGDPMGTVVTAEILLDVDVDDDEPIETE